MSRTFDDKWINEFTELLKHAAKRIEEIDDQLPPGCLGGFPSGPSEKAQDLLFKAGQVTEFLRNREHSRSTKPAPPVDIVERFKNSKWMD